MDIKISQRKILDYILDKWKAVVEACLIERSILVLGSIATVIGLWIAIPQLQLANKQLEELNTSAKIEIRFHIASATISLGPLVSDPVSVQLSAINKGGRTTDYWRASVVFCKNIIISNSPGNWIKLDQNQYVFESEKVIPPSFSGKSAFYSDALDNVGNFSILFPSDLPQPVGQITISGNYPDPTAYLVVLNKDGFSYENLLQADGKIIPDFLQKLQGCFNILDQTS